MVTGTQLSVQIYNKIIGKEGEDFYLLHSIRTAPSGKYIIEAYVLRPITDDDVSDAEGNYDYKLSWQDAVANGDTERGLRDWMERETGSVELGELFDLAPSAYAKLVYEHFDEDDCQGVQRYDSGQCFVLNMVWDELYEPNIWQIIKKILLENSR
jgi:hypothetical protein